VAGAADSRRISAVIPTYRRPGQLSETLRHLVSCHPPPDELIIHVDAGDAETAGIVREAFPQVRVLTSTERMGPGGGRNKLVTAASHDLVASFDDDSYPLDKDYFARVKAIFDAFPDAAAVGSTITDKGNAIADARQEIGPTVHFGGGGVTYRRSDFLATGGYVPLPVAYGMEEVDLCLRLTAAGKKIYFSPWLRVFHDNDLGHHATPAVTAGSIANLALLVFLRYPLRFWPHGAMQVFNRIVWLLRVGRFSGVVSGIAHIPVHLWRHRDLRGPVCVAGIKTFLRMRRLRVPLRPLVL